VLKKRYHAMKTYRLLNWAPRREEVLGERRYSSTHSSLRR